MPQVALYNQQGAQVGEITLNETIFGIEPHKQAMFDAVIMQRASMRQGTHKTKTRTEVRGGGRKPWKQKGTGRARQGSTRAPHWIKGGIVFGPHPRSYTKKMNRKERRLALKSALSYKVLDKELVVLDNFVVESNKTKDMKAILNNLNATNKTLIVVEELTDNVILGTRNLSNIVLLEASEINTLDIIAADKMIITEAAVKAIEEVLA